jgi:sulfide:quinone oxidoreductase
MHSRVLVLGAGFAGLELATVLSEELGEDAGVTLIDASDAFVFGYSKLDVMFGHSAPDEVRLPYAEVDKTGVRFLREQIVSIDPEARTATTNGGTYDADFLAIALGADYDVEGTPGLADANEFYSVAGAERLRDVLPSFTSGRAVVGVCGSPFKCPPAPSEAALLLHDYLLQRGVRDDCELSFVTPMSTPVPPSPDTSAALIAAFAERGIAFLPKRTVISLDAERGVAVLADGDELPYDLFLGVPKHCAPAVVVESGLAEDGFIPADSATLATRFAGVYAVGDVAKVGVPKAGVFSEGQARVVAASILAQLRGEEAPPPYNGRAGCYIEFGAGRVGRVDVDFLSGATVTATYHGASEALVAERQQFGASRRARWFGR